MEQQQYHAEHEKKFLPRSLSVLPPLVGGTDIMQFYFPNEKAFLEGNILHYASKKNPLLELSPAELATVERFLAWPKPPKVRIRIAERGRETMATLTIKVDERIGAGEPIPEQSDMIKNLEFERPINPKIAEKLLYKLGGNTKSVIAKTRYNIYSTVDHPTRGRTHHFRKPFEVDVFKGPNSFIGTDRRIINNIGLYVIELEVSPGEVVLPELLPDWVGLDITSDKRFTNSRLSREPFAKWPAEERNRLIQP